jgi:transposase
VSQKTRSTFVVCDPSEILRALVGLKDVEVLHYQRSGSDVELMIEQVLGEVRCPTCAGGAQVKDRPVVHYVDLPVFGTPMSLAWKKHRMRCVDPACPKKSWTLEDHRIVAKHCLLTTRAAKWATVQVGGGRTVFEVAAELACDWHTLNDAVTTYGTALLEADRKRLNQTTAIGLDETSFVKSGRYSHTSFATTVADVENHQIIDMLPTREYVDVAGWMLGGSTWPSGVPAQIHYTLDDPFRHQESIEAVVKAIHSAKARVEIFDYPGNGHLFTDASLPHDYDAVSSELLWQRVFGISNGSGRHVQGTKFK